MDKSKITIVLLGIAVILLVMNYFQIAGMRDSLDGATGFAAASPGKPLDLVKGAVPVKFYVMSQCPYGTQVENAIAPVLKTLEGYVDFRLDYIASGSNGNFNSLHGQPEVDGDMIQLCVQENYPAESMDFVSCQNKNPGDLTSTIDSCSAQAGIDANTIKSCWQGQEGISLMEASIANSNKAGATGSPTIFINNKPYSGARSSQAFLTAICNELADKPEACSAVVLGSDVAAVTGGCG